MIGNRIKSIRKEKNLTQVYVSKALGYKHPSMLSEIESGKKRLYADKLPVMAKILDVEINQFFLDCNSQIENRRIKNDFI